MASTSSLEHRSGARRARGPRPPEGGAPRVFVRVEHPTTLLGPYAHRHAGAGGASALLVRAPSTRRPPPDADRTLATLALWPGADALDGYLYAFPSLRALVRWFADPYEQAALARLGFRVSLLAMPRTTTAVDAFVGRTQAVLRASAVVRLGWWSCEDFFALARGGALAERPTLPLRLRARLRALPPRRG